MKLSPNIENIGSSLSIQPNRFWLNTPLANYNILYMRNDRGPNVLVHARENFSQSETSSLLRGPGGSNYSLHYFSRVKFYLAQKVGFFHARASDKVIRRGGG